MELGPYFLIGSLVLFVSLITVVTLMFSTRQVTKGYVLNKLQSEHQNLVKESEKQEMQISMVRALDHIKESSRVQRMRKAGNIVFVDGQTSIASR